MIVAAFWLMCVLVLGGAAVAQAQSNELPDLDSINPDEFEVESDMLGRHSAGWFPRPYPGYTLSFMVAGGQGSDVWDKASGLRSTALVPTTFAFTHRNPYANNDQRTIIKPFARTDDSDGEEDEYPETDYEEYSLLFTANLPFPAVVRAEAGLLVTDGILFSSDKTRRFLAYSGTRQSFHEVGVLHREEWLLKGSIGVDVPVYGAFVQVEDLVISSYYYVHGSVTGVALISGKSTQYAQIADVKDGLRYANGTDTVRLQPRGEWDNVHSFRTALSVGIGWNISVQFFSLRLEPFIMIPLTSVLRDAEWKQYMGGIRLSLGYQWGTGI